MLDRPWGHCRALGAAVDDKPSRVAVHRGADDQIVVVVNDWDFADRLSEANAGRMLVYQADELCFRVADHGATGRQQHEKSGRGLRIARRGQGLWSKSHRMFDLAR
jgi:hypothetical protein